jgi:uncharacterized protein (DUF433 family)
MFAEVLPFWIREVIWFSITGPIFGAACALLSQCPAVESSPEKVSGAWVFRGTRMPVATVFENLEAGATMEDIMAWFDLSREQIVTVLDFAARSLTARD